MALGAFFVREFAAHHTQAHGELLHKRRLLHGFDVAFDATHGSIAREVSVFRVLNRQTVFWSSRFLAALQAKHVEHVKQRALVVARFTAVHALRVALSFSLDVRKHFDTR